MSPHYCFSYFIMCSSCIYFNLQINNNDISDDDESLEFWDMVLGGAKMAENMWSYIWIKIRKE
jgi:hypothetical protein